MQYFTLHDVLLEYSKCFFWNTAKTKIRKNNAACSLLVILSSNLKEGLYSVVTWPHCVSKCTSHSYNKLYPVKNRKSNLQTWFNYLKSMKVTDTDNSYKGN